MSKIADLPQLGILPLQHHDDSWPLELRNVTFAARVIDRDESGRYIVELDSQGDVECQTLWNRDSRPVSGWANVWPSIVTEVVPSSPKTRSRVTKALSDPLDALRVMKAEGKAGDRSSKKVQLAGISVAPRNDGNVPVHLPGGVGQTEVMPGESTDTQVGVTDVEPVAPDPGVTTTEPTKRSSPMFVLPLRENEMIPDVSFSSKEPVTPVLGGVRVWPKFPLGTIGLTTSLTNETEQIDSFFPTDPRLVSVNCEGRDGIYGSLVYDLDGQNNYDPKRSARLHSALRVIKIGQGRKNVLAFQLGKSGAGDTRGGLFCDQADACTVVIGDGSRYRGGGPFDVGSKGDKHILAHDDDGNPINSLHIGTNALFRRDNLFDGGLLFEGPFPEEEPEEGPYDALVHCEFDFAMGKWRWRTEVNEYVPDPWLTPVPVPTPSARVPVPRPSTPTSPTAPSGGGPGGGPGSGPGKKKKQQQPDKPTGECTPTGHGETENTDPLTAKETPKTGTPVPGDTKDLPPNERPVTGHHLTPDTPPPTEAGKTWKDGDSGGPGSPGRDPYWDERPAPGTNNIGEPLRPFQTAGNGPGGTGRSSSIAPAETALLTDVDLQEPFGGTSGLDTGGLAEARISPASEVGPASSGTVMGSVMEQFGQNALGHKNLVAAAPTPGTGAQMLTAAASSAFGGNSVQPTAATPVPQDVAQSGLMKANPGEFATPQNNTPGEPNAAGSAKESKYSKCKKNRNEPKTGQKAAYGAQGGRPGGDESADNEGAEGEPWKYNQKPGPGSKFQGGTANGGWVIIPPEISLADTKTGLKPPQVQTSQTTFGVGPGAYFFAGLPDLATGGMFTGFSWEADFTTGDLIFFAHDSQTVRSEAMRFTNSSENIKWNSATIFQGELDHAITANRTWTFPDGTGAMMVTNVPISGNVLVGSTSASPGAGGGAVVVFGDNTTDPTMAANTSGIYGKDVAGTVEVFVIDEANNASQISPHDRDTGEWIFYSKNTKTGRVLRVDMERLLGEVNDFLGLDCFHEYVELDHK